MINTKIRKTRIYVEPPLSMGEVIVLKDEIAHHLLNVLRRRQGDLVDVFNGHGGYFESEIVNVNKKGVSVRLNRYIKDSSEGELNLTLVQGISRGHKMDYIVQKAVELGVNTISPLLSEFSNVKLEGDRIKKRLLHWQKVIINACEQSGRNIIPRIELPITIDRWVELSPNQDRIVLHPGAPETLASISPKSKNIALICGPEGGLSETELALCVEKGCRMASLGPRILRTETAAITALAVCQSHWGDIR